MVPYEIKRSKRKTLALEVDSSARLIVRAPLRMSERMIAAFLHEKKSWIAAALQEMEQHAARKQQQYTDGSQLWYKGNAYTIRIIPAATLRIEIHENDILVHIADARRVKEYVIAWLTRRARQYIIPRTKERATDYGYTIKGIRITSARTRWGSCSGTNAISFSWRLIQAPLPVIEYVIIHELVHTVHKNHGPRFWKQVAKHDPKYRLHRDWLRDNAIELDI